MRPCIYRGARRRFYLPSFATVVSLPLRRWHTGFYLPQQVECGLCSAQLRRPAKPSVVRPRPAMPGIRIPDTDYYMRCGVRMRGLLWHIKATRVPLDNIDRMSERQTHFAFSCSVSSRPGERLMRALHASSQVRLRHWQVQGHTELYRADLERGIRPRGEGLGWSITLARSPRGSVKRDKVVVARSRDTPSREV